MDPVTLEKLEFDRVREILSRFCRCALGEGLARRIAPSSDAGRVRTWLAQTTEMVDTLREVGLPPFGGITDITAALDRAVPSGGATGEDFAAIASTLKGIGEVRRWSEALGASAPLLVEMTARLEDFTPQVEAIERVIDERGEVRDSASPRLASIRAEAAGCAAQIRQIVYAFVRRPDVAQYLQATTVQMHEDRFVIPVKAEHRGRLPGVVHRASHTGATLFVEPAECVQLNNRLVALAQKEHDEITRLLGELAIAVHRRSGAIARCLRTLAQIDLLAAKAQYAYQFDMTCPEVAEGGPIVLYACRHPLLVEQAARQDAQGVEADQRHDVVPIDVRLGADFDLLIITGSNTGGKTVTLKTVGLLSLMAHSGLHIPARRGATLRLLRDVLLDVGDEQSLQQSLSTFGGHLMRIKHILGRANPHTLVLLDELGSGTDPEEGGAIGQAILDELRRRGCPGMITTHLGTLKAYAYNHDRVENASVEFDTATLRPTYRLLIGTPGESHAIAVAEHYGLPQSVLRAAREHLPRTGRQLRRAIRATSVVRQASEEARAAAEAARLEAQQHQELYQSKLADLQGLTDQFTDWLAGLSAMQPGDELFVRRFKRTGTLVRLQLSRQVAVVNMGGMEAEIPLQELMPEPAAAGAEQILSLRRQTAEHARQVQGRLEEAERLQQAARRHLAAIEQRQAYVNAWLDRIATLAVGAAVAFDRPPGRGTVQAMDLAGGKVTVEADGQTLELRLQELFPESGAFGDRRRRAGRPEGQGQGRDQDQEQGQADRPVPHRRADSARARANRRTVAAMDPGSEVYVVPFQKRATLVRVDEARAIAVVQSGAFEMQVNLADVEPLGHTGPQPQRRRRRRPAPPGETPPSPPAEPPPPQGP
ncbi:MAG: hypothetical protein GX591_20320 [Planctomycetes bacterium]|nr:hypothetical protein [Planctomycetota bacterium]